MFKIELNFVFAVNNTKIIGSKACCIQIFVMKIKITFVISDLNFAARRNDQRLIFIVSGIKVKW